MRNFSNDYQACNVSSHLLKVREIDVVNILEKEMRGHICSALPSHLYFAFTYVASVGEPSGCSQLQALPVSAPALQVT